LCFSSLLDKSIHGGGTVVKGQGSHRVVFCFGFCLGGGGDV